MAVYNTGSVTVKVGSAKVIGSSGVDFTSDVSAGDLFKLKSESTFYDVASVNNATSITLSARFANSNYNLNATGEVAATIAAGTIVYSGTLDNTPVVQSNVVLLASDIRLVDDGAGNLSGTNAEGTHEGSINYDTGAWTITFAATADIVGAEITGSYVYGNTLNGMPYQIVTDYTPNYTFPELGLNDTNFQHIYTKAVRMIDSALYNVNASSVNASHDVSVLATPSGFVTYSDDGTGWRIRVTNNGTVTATQI